MARAVYQEADVVLMDDPISALDANVRKKIFKHVFQGMLKNKTRVLVTHAIDFLHLTDRIVVLKDGKIQANGSFAEIQDDPHLQVVLEINRKNLEESKQAQESAFISKIDSQLLHNGSDSDSPLLGNSNHPPSSSDEMKSALKVNRTLVQHESVHSGGTNNIRITQGSRNPSIILEEVPENRSSNMMFGELDKSQNRAQTETLIYR